MEYKIVPNYLVEESTLDNTPVNIEIGEWDTERLQVYSFKAPPSLIATVTIMAKKQGKTRSELIRELLEKYVMGTLVEVVDDES